MLGACSSSTDYVGLEFEVLVPDGFDWSRVAKLAVDLDDGTEPQRAETAVTNGSFELIITPRAPKHRQIAHVSLLDAAGVEVAAGGTPPFVPVEVPAVTLRVFAVARGQLGRVPGLLPTSRPAGTAITLFGQYVLVVSDAADGGSVALYDGLTHQLVPGVADAPADFGHPRGVEIAPGTALVLGDALEPQLYVASLLTNRWIAALLGPPYEGPTPGACVTSLPGGGALVAGGRDSDGQPRASVLRVGADGLSASQPDLAAPRGACRIIAFGETALVLSVPADADPPLLYDLSTGTSAELAGAGAETTAAAALPDGSLFLLLRDGRMMRLPARPAGSVAVEDGEYVNLGSVRPARIEPEVVIVGDLGGFVLGGTDPGGEPLDGGVSFGVDVFALSTVEAAPARGAAAASLPDVGLLVLGGADAPDRVMVLRP